MHIPQLESRRLIDGLIAGLAAGAISSAPGAVAVIAGDTEWWYPVQLIATIFGAATPVDFNPATFVAGGIIHFAISAGYGIVLALLTTSRQPLVLVGGGALFGLAVFALDFYLFDALGLFTELHRGADYTVELLAHLTFGLAAGAVLWIRRRRA